MSHEKNKALKEGRFASLLSWGWPLGLVIRIASSQNLKKSPVVCQFLLFVAERSLTGGLEEIIKYATGSKAFEWGMDCSPLDGGGMRTTVSQLCANVTGYFQTRGAHEAWLLQVRKSGGYDGTRPEGFSPPAKAGPYFITLSSLWDT